MSEFIPDNEDGRIPFEVHKKHHYWVEGEMIESKVRKERKEKVRTSITFAIIWFGTMSLMSVLGYAAVRFIQEVAAK